MHQSMECVFITRHPLPGSQSHANCLFLTHAWSQVAAAFAELAIPHFATSSIFAAATTGATSASFQHYLQLLGVLVVVFGVSAALRGYCFSVLNNRMTMRLRCGAGVGSGAEIRVCGGVNGCGRGCEKDVPGPLQLW